MKTGMKQILSALVFLSALTGCISPMDILCSSNFPGVSEASSLLQEISNKDSMK